MEQIPVVLIIILICIIVFLILKNKKPKDKQTNPDVMPSESAKTKKANGFPIQNKATHNIQKLGNNLSSMFNDIRNNKIDKVTKTKSQAFNGTIIQLADANDTDYKDGVVKAYPIGVIPPEGICINRTDAEFIPGQITIKSYRGYQQYINSNAYYIYTDSEGHPIISLKTSCEKRNGAYFDNGRYINPILLYNIADGTSHSVPAFELVDEVAFSLGGDQWFLYKAWKSESAPPPIKNINQNAVASPTQVFANNSKNTRRAPLYKSEIDPDKLP